MIEFNDDAIRQVADEAARQMAARVQVVYDYVLDVGRDKSVDQVKALLISQWQMTFGTVPTDPELSRVAGALAEGRRVEVKPTAM